MTFQIQDICSIVSLVFVFLGGIFALFQYVRSKALERCERIRDVIENLRSKPELAEVEYKLEYNDDWYDETFHGGDFEKKIDEFLSCMNFICFLYKYRMIRKIEINLVKYELISVCQNKQIQQYLWNLCNYAKRNNVASSFDELIGYGIRNKYISKEIYNPDSKKFGKKYLNF